MSFLSGQSSTEQSNNTSIHEEPVDFDNLVNDILDNPEILLNTKLTAEQVLEVQKRLNPYAGIAGPVLDVDKKRIAAVSYTNLREEYLRRFTATSLVGFLFQVSQEWEVPADLRSWVPTTVEADKPFNTLSVVERLESELLLAKEAHMAATAAVEEKRVANEMDAVLSGTASDAEKAAVKEKYELVVDLEAKAAGLLYATTHALYQNGVEAGKRLRVTADMAMSYPSVKEVLSKCPLPAPYGQVELPETNAKEIITSFLKHWFMFDPNVHVRSGHDAKTISQSVAGLNVGNSVVLVDTKDPGHLTVEAVRETAPTPAKEHKDAVSVILKSKQSYNAAVALLRDDDLVDAVLLAVSNSEAFRQYLFPVPANSPARPAVDVVPPQDTFHRWSYYTEVNYEELRTVTEALYPERPDLDWAVALWDVFEGTQAEVDAAFDKHCQRFQDEVPSAIKALEFGAWSLLADFKENRKKIQFYNKNTEVLKRILDRHSDDKRIGAELMRNRVRQTKARNIAAEGPDAPGLSQYKRNVAEKGQNLGSKGVEKVISAEEMRRLEKSKGSIKAAKELELLEQVEKTIKELGEMEKLRPLTSEEAEDLTKARNYIDRVREMVAVPDDAIQVDVFTNNPSTGGFERSSFYTKAEGPPSGEKEENRQ